MSHITELVERVRATAPRFTKCPEHQQLVYAVESIVAVELSAPYVDLWNAQAFIEEVCLDLDVDIPAVERHKIEKRFVACASHSRYTITISASTVSTLTLCHELAHLLVHEHAGHHKEWRNQFVELARRYVSVEHGALLHSLYNRCGLDTAWK